jgi:hypothetical protein
MLYYFTNRCELSKEKEEAKTNRNYATTYGRVQEVRQH